MKKTIILLIVMLVVIVGSLSGCDEADTNDSDNGYSDEIEIVNYQIETFGAELGIKPEKIGNGFIHTEIAKNGYYKITGTIKNIAGRILNNVTIKADFYDINKSYLTSKSEYVENLANTKTHNFKIIYLGSSSHFEKIDQMEFDISIS
jgi:hypothetical protein